MQSKELDSITIHKRNERIERPLVSVILLDWSCRERFHSLDWLKNQSIPREQYELIWVELFERVVPKALLESDVLLTCGQKGTYHKHKGYNAGLLQSRGQIVTVCDSDAVFPPDFIESIIRCFGLSGGEPENLVLMHHEWRTDSEYPEHLASIDGVSAFTWKELWPNVGACVSVRHADAIRFGGFDEHDSYRGFICGPYDIAWRLVNAGLPQTWHDASTALWHFAHPAPYFHPRRFSLENLRRWFEVTHPHCEYHALTAVEAFSTGRMLPLQENPEVHNRRLELRRIGTAYEEKYATMTGPEGFSKAHRLGLRLALMRESLMRWSGVLVWLVEKVIGTPNFEALLKTKQRFRAFLVKKLEKWLGPARFEMLKKRLG